MPPRRSARLRALSGQAGNDDTISKGTNNSTRRKRQETTSANKRQTTTKGKQKAKTATTDTKCLPRTRETSLFAKNSNLAYMVGVDEAGRGPLAGPVVAAAWLSPLENVPGIQDSKRINKEDQREELCEQLMALPNSQWAAAVVDAARIDEINILQATLEGMRSATMALVNPGSLEIPLVEEASIDQTGCYVVVSKAVWKDVQAAGTGTKKNQKKKAKVDEEATTTTSDSIDEAYYALVDGNKVPSNMPCATESIIKGDSKEYCIAGASIFAKVIRDRLMHGYDKLYPEYNFLQHKGYPTKAHIAMVYEHGASPIHRLTFAPLKHMEFDAQGKILSESKPTKIVTRKK